MFKKLLGLVALSVGFLSTITADASPVGGAKALSTRVDAYSTDSYSMVLYGGETSQILVRGDGDTDLDCYVYGEDGALIVQDIRSSDVCGITITPVRVMEVRIDVKNRGDVYNAYRIQVQ